MEVAPLKFDPKLSHPAYMVVMSDFKHLYKCASNKLLGFQKPEKDHSLTEIKY